MEVRPATPGDVTGIERVASASWDADYPTVLNRENVAESARHWYDADGIAREIRQPDTPVLVAVDDDEVVGFAHAYVGRGAGTILRVYVTPDRRGEGVGKRLVEHTVETLFQSGAEHVDATVLADNEAGRAFYEALEFELEDTTGRTTIGGEAYDEYTYRLTR